MRQRILYIDAGSGESKQEEVDEPSLWGPIDFALRVWDGGRTLVFGAGPLAGSIVPGSNRLTFAGYSPAWDGFFASTMGGAALPFDDVWPNFVAITGRAARPSVLLVTMRDGDLRVALRPLDPEPIWRGFDGLDGFYALQSYVLENVWRGVGEPRVLATGPAALATNFGAIGSARVKNGRATPVDTWCGRGGFGSQLAQAHGIVAVAYSGNFHDQDLRDVKDVDGIFKAKFSKKMMLVDLEKTVKYRYDPKFATGGTLGSNFSSLRELMFSFNYQSVRMSDGARLALWERLVRDHYLKQFNEETIAAKQGENALSASSAPRRAEPHASNPRHDLESSSARHQGFNCGEPCPAVCKKMNNEFKKDYEPYMGLGPNAGVFDQRAAERLNRRADALGFDAIQAAGIVSAMMEALAEGALRPTELGVASVPTFAPEGFAAVGDSAHNAEIAIRLLERIAFREAGEPARQGPRALARAVPAVANRMAYVSNGDANGSMIPSFYWVPGMYAPIPLAGRYYCYYGYDYHEPRALGRLNAERMVKEVALDNLGVCRFHRGWAEDLFFEIVNDHFHSSYDFAAHHRELARRLWDGCRVRPWESARTREIVRTYLEKHVRDGEKDATCAGWAARFAKDEVEAARAYWDELFAGAREGIG